MLDKLTQISDFFNYHLNARLIELPMLHRASLGLLIEREDRLRRWPESPAIFFGVVIFGNVAVEQQFEGGPFKRDFLGRECRGGPPGPPQ